MQFNHWKPILLSAAALAIVCSSIAWGNNQTPNATKTLQDTVPQKQKKKQPPTVITGDLNEALKSLDKTLEQLQLEFSDAKMEKLRAEMERSLSALDEQKMEKEMGRALKELEDQKLLLKTQEALNSINAEKMQQDIEKALKDARTTLESKQLETELKKALTEIKKIDTKQIELQLEKAREEMLQQKEHLKMDMEKAKADLKTELSNHNFKEEMTKARAEIAAAKEELTNYKNLIHALEKDGLLKAGENYGVEYDNGILTINGKKQTEATSNKYKSYFKKDKVRLQKEDTYQYHFENEEGKKEQ
jgi:chromosome segregation ATPase